MRALARATALCSAAVLCLAAAGCSPPVRVSPGSMAAPQQVAASRPAPVRTTKILTIVIENHSLTQMRQGMPYLNRLARRYGYATDYRAVTHPSLPNYLAIAFGTTAGVTDDGPPRQHRVKGDSVISLARRNGTGARVYAESMRDHCQRTNTYPYAVKHNPWAYGSAGCASGDVPAGTPKAGRLRSDAASGRLPCAGMLVPNLIHDAHDASLATADRYLQSWLPTLMAGPDFRSGRLAIVITADEANRSSTTNRVLTVVLSRSVSHKVVRTRLTHYSLARLYGTTCHESRLLGKASSARSMRVAFGLTN
ncbi:alkaline phosphatase family protein [Microlunatus panaciterrae]|uniref:Acid phosphatase n=1 Tax=Microlunatus panaciterrae TaxID=400768 RepID=A0ABS2RL81_9ACTN|nr:alkaline phosphatase family protein [Microlunatus panaciterrae]MBM7799332.1 acid phosphatase [Microlunatus panaciterrae]